MAASRRKENSRPRNRRRLQQAFGGLGQAVEARHEHALDGVWHRHGGLQVAVLKNCSGQFLQEKGIAFGFGQDHLLQAFGQHSVLRHGPHHHHTVLRGQLP